MAVEERRAPLTERQVEQMLTVFLRKKTALESARRQLTSESFAPHHKNLAAFWTVLCDHVDEFNDLPDETDLMGEIERRMDEDPEALSDEEVEMLDAFINRAYRVPVKNITARIVKVAFKYLRVYLEERIADRIRTDLTTSTYTPSDLCSLLDTYKMEVSRVQSLEPTGLQKPFPSGWNQQQRAVEKTDTGLEFLNSMLNGGQAEKEVYGILAPHGSCKTTIGIQYGTLNANRLRREWLAADKEIPLKIVYMFIYESDVEEMRLRALSSLGCIHRDVLEQNDWDQLSSGDQKKPYERKMFRQALQQGRKVPSEQERWRYTERALNVNWRCVDMTGNDPQNPGRGWGLVDEISQIIQMDQDYWESQGQLVGVGPIIIDYAGAAVKRYLDHHNKDYSSEMRHLISSFPMQCKNKLAIRYRTQVLALHQLTGQANALSSGVLPKSTDAAEAKNWRENLDFSFVAGNPDPNNYVIFGCDKHRRAPGVSEVVIKIQGALCRVDADPTMAVDKVRKAIVPKRELRSIEDDDTSRPSHYDDDDDGDSAVDTMAAESSALRGHRMSPGGRRAEGR